LPLIVGTSTLAPRIASVNKNKSAIDVQKNFPKELERLLQFREESSYIIIKPKQFLGSENFAKIASIARELGGEYISAGRDSHFRVSKN